MEDFYTPDDVRTRLINAGLKELDKHGVVDFSLRRVALEAGVSCAAPYRHFKDKDELISAIIAYVMDGWMILSSSISEIYSTDAKQLISELSVAGLRFWIGNGNFRTVIITLGGARDGNSPEMARFDSPIKAAIGRYCQECGRLDSELLCFKALSLLYGSVMLVDGGYEDTDKAAEALRSAISSILI